MKKFLLPMLMLFMSLSISATVNKAMSKSTVTKESVTISVNGQNRSMIVYSPKSAVDNMPLMIVTHGMNQNPEYQAYGDDAPNYTGGDRIWEMCDTAKFVVAYLRSDGNTWDTGGTKDIDFVNQTIDEMQKKFNINTNRVYWSGFSMGSMLIYHTLAQVNSNAKAESLVKRIACFAPTSGMQFSENPANSLKAKNMKINLIDHHSRQDGVFPINQYDIKTYVTNIAKSNEFTTYFSKDNYNSQEGNYKGLKEVWTNSTTGNVIELFMYDGGGHWPSWYNRKEIWNFCKRFSLMSLEEEYNNIYNHAVELIDEWKDTPEMTSKAVYTTLKNALDTYSPENTTTDAARNKAITRLSTIIGVFNTASQNITKVQNGGATEQPSTFDPNFHIYLCFGQSNMEGNAAIEAQDRKDVDPRFMMMAAVDMNNMNRKKFNWYTAYPPLCRGYNGLTPADYFGREMVANLPENIRVGVINVAVGGASIKLFDEDELAGQLNGAADWFKNYCKEYDNNPYKRLVECAKEAQKYGVIKGILLHQGCTDNTQKDWPVRVKRVYIRLLNDLGLKEEETPLLVGELLQQDMGGVCWGHNAVIAHITDAIPNAYVISSKKCPSASDGLHFTAEGYRMIGRRYAEQMLKILDQKKEIDFNTEEEGYFPFNHFNHSLYMQGSASGTTTTSSLLTFKTGKDNRGNFGGWRYSKGVDLSAYNYLVFTLARASSYNSSVRIYDTDDYLNPCYKEAMKSSQKVASIDLHNMTTDAGNKVDPSHIYMVGINSDTAGDATTYIKSVFLSDDGETPTNILYVNENLTDEDDVIYNLNGQRLSAPTQGINIINGKKVFKR